MTGSLSRNTTNHNRQVLPTNIKPSRYDLTLEPHFDTFKFTGEVVIDYTINDKLSDFISLNTLELDIESAHLLDSDNTKPHTISYDEDSQTTTFKFDAPLAANRLHIKFTGDLNDKMAGFYRSSYEEDGVKKYLATTQFEPTDCRRAFPSYDEPAAKAIFDIKLIADKKFTCLSNMDVKETHELPNGKQKVIFNSTPLMSTYLVAFIVGDLRYVETNDYKVPVRVYTTPGLEKQGLFSMDLAAKTLAFFDKAFDIDYPLPKMDMVAIHDFSAGAMENYGLVTYRVVDLLFDEETSTLATKQRVAEVVQHELAHQWFGNLVTMEWWNALFLNEAFATWMSWYSCNKFFPEWKVWEQYVSDSLQHALALDALRSSHPIDVPVNRADEINQIFDAISYSKGSSVLKMIANWIGEETFIKGVSNYLKAHAWGNAEPVDLWEALSEASGKDVVKIMDVWTKKVGYPVLTVTEDGDKIHIKQNRYLTTGDVKPEEDTVIYPVFLGLQTKDGVDDIVFDERETTIQLKDASFYKLNYQQAGIYRTSYSQERWEKLGKAALEGLLSVEDRTGLVSDARALATSGYSSTASLLSLINGWKKENSYVVWEEILTAVQSIYGAWIFESDEVKQGIKNFTKDLVSLKAKEMGYTFAKDESFLDQQLKTLLFGRSLFAGDESSVEFAKALFAKFVKGDKSAIHPNLRGAIFNAVAREGGVEEYEALYTVYKTTETVDERIASLRSLGQFSSPELIQRTLGYLLDGTVRSQDIYIPMQGLALHKDGIELLFSWLTQNWDEIYKKLPPGLSMLGSVVGICCSQFTKPEQKKLVEDFFAEKNTKGFDQGLAQSLDRIQSKISWIQRDSANVEQWLKSNGYM